MEHMNDKIFGTELVDNKENSGLGQNLAKPKAIYVLEDVVLNRIDLDKNLVVRVVENSNGRFVDIRRFYKNYPTKRGVRFSYAAFRKIKELINE